jgi:hypothetical protein
MPFPRLKDHLRRTNRLIAGFVDVRSQSWDGHELVVLGRFDVLRD